MGAAVIAVVFIAGLIGVPTLFGHGESQAQPSASAQQVASVQTPAQPGGDATLANAVDAHDADTARADADANRP
ncbi:MAG: hypothetical protein LBV73_04935 [Paraburkholderia sp.]|jgi:hypothetical protein|nr:hypothetical protein [Paraburkholderia sp.]